MYLLVSALLIAADQITKLWAQRAFAGGDSLQLGLGFSFTYVENNGAAFGILRNLSIPLGPVLLDGTLLLGLLSGVVALGLLIYLFGNARNLSFLALSALTLIFSGAVGNMIDRLRLGYVIDFILFRQPNFDFPVFNLADSFVVVGAALLFLGSLASRPGRRADGDETRHKRHLSEADFFRSLEFDPSSEQR